MFPELLSQGTQILAGMLAALAVVAGCKHPKAPNALYEPLQHVMPSKLS